MPKKNYDEDVREQGLEEERDAAFRSWVEKNSPHGAFKAVNADPNSESAPNGGISFDDGYFVYNDGKGGHFTEWNGEKTETDWLGNPVKSNSFVKDESVPDADEKTAKPVFAGGDMLSEYVSSKSNQAQNARSLEDIYKEYLGGAYYKNTIEEGKRVAEDVLGKYASMTGGLPSTAATYAATSAGEGVMTDAQKYLWQLAQKQYETERQDARGDAEADKSKYTEMIDAYLSMGYGVDDIPDEWWVRSGYDRTYAGGVENYMKKQNETATEKSIYDKIAESTEADRTYFRNLLQTYVNKGREIPSWLWEAAGLDGTPAQADYAKAEAEKPTGVTVDTIKDYSEYTKNALALFNSGDGAWETYVESIPDDDTYYRVVNYLSSNAKYSARDYAYNESTKKFVDNFGNYYDENKLREKLNNEKKNDPSSDLDVGKFIKNIKEKVKMASGKV